jgi:hypothetical protein
MSVNTSQLNPRNSFLWRLLSLAHGFSAMTDCKRPSLFPINLLHGPLRHTIVDVLQFCCLALDLARTTLKTSPVITISPVHAILHKHIGVRSFSRTEIKLTESELSIHVRLSCNLHQKIQFQIKFLIKTLNSCTFILTGYGLVDRGVGVRVPVE